jgi:CheY-like chemotaxis protein/anti-sigma regulatory factor (Ser/Thr protein kinase)
VLTASIANFPVNSVLQRIEATFATAAREKGLRLRVVPSSAWVRSDAVLLERILLNLVSNAVRYTSSGGIVVGCRRGTGGLRIEVWDSGIGISEDHQRNIFGEFYQVVATEREGRDGLGLGLAIVDRLCALLHHAISLRSIPGMGSRFGISLPTVPAPVGPVAPPVASIERLDPLRGKLIVVIDDDAVVLTGTGGLLKNWGCRVVTAASDHDALGSLDRDMPDLIISDFRLKQGRTGIEAIARIRDAFHAIIPAFVISGDISPERLSEVQASGHHLLHKPVNPMTLRAMMSRILQEHDRAYHQ